MNHKSGIFAIPAISLLSTAGLFANTEFTWTDNAGNNNWASSSNWSQTPGSGDYPGQNSNLDFVTLDGSQWGSGGTSHFDIDLTTASAVPDLVLGRLTITTDGNTDDWQIQNGPQAATITMLGDFTTNLDGGGTATMENDLYISSSASSSVRWKTSGNKLVLNGALKGSPGATLFSFGSNGGGITLNSAGDFAGAIYVKNNSLEINHVNALADAEVQIGSGATFSYIADSNIGGLAGDGPVDLPARLNFGGNNLSTSHTGLLSGAGALHKTGSGTWTRGGTGTHTGTFYIDDGVVKLASVNGLAESLVWLNSSNGLDLNGQDPTIGGLGGTGTLDLGSNTLTIGGAHDGVHLGVISGTGGIRINTAGSQTFGLGNTYSGGTVLDEGTLVCDAEGDLGATSGALTVAGGTYHATATHSQSRSLEFEFPSTSVEFNIDNGKTLTWSGPISNPSNLQTLTKTGLGTLLLSNDTNFFPGTIRIEGGQLSITGTTANVSVISSDLDNSLLLADADTTIGMLIGSGDLEIGNGKSLTIGNGDRDGSYSGNLTDGTLIKTGNGTFIFSGTCSSANPVELDEGTIEIEGGLVTAQLPGVNSATGTTLTGNGRISVGLFLNGDIAPGAAGSGNYGTIRAGGVILSGGYHCEIAPSQNDLFEATGTLHIAAATLELANPGGIPGNPAFIIATYGTLNGTFHSINGLPAGYNIDYAFDDGISTKNIAIVQDSTPPTVTITTTQGSPTNADSITYNIAFSEPVTGLVDYTDFYITGTTVATTGTTATTIINSGDDQNFTLTLHDLSGDGFLQFRLRSNQIADLAGNHLVSDPFSPGRTIDNTPPVITLSGASAITVVVGATWTDPGACATESAAIVPGGDSVNTATPGNYTITYDATDAAGNAATQVTRSVTVITAFDNWAAANGLTPGVNDAMNEDPNQDGKTNLEHFAFDTDPLGDGSGEGKFVSSITEEGGERHLVLTLPARTGAIFSGTPLTCTAIDGINYQILGDDDLGGWDLAVEEVTPALSSGLPALDDNDSISGPNWEYHTFRLSAPLSNKPRGFLSVKMSTAP